MRHGASAAALVLITSLATPASADGGYFGGSKGARAAGRGGAFTARADDASAIFYNPAGLTRTRGTMIQLGDRLSYNAHTFERAPTLDWSNLDGGVPPFVEFEPVANRAPWQLLEPMLAVVSDLGLREWAFAFGVSAPAGVGRQEFPLEGAQRYMMVSREARILNYTGSVAWSGGDRFGVGATLQWIHVPRLRYQLVVDANTFPAEVNPVSSELDMLVTVDGSDPFTLQAIAGAWFRPTRAIELAVAVQVLPAELRTASTLAIEPLSPEIDEDVVLRRAGARADDVELILPLPLWARAAIRYVHRSAEREVFDVELDVAYEGWSRVRSFTMDGDGLTAHLLAQRIDVGLIEIEKEWRDTLSVRVGGDYHLLPDVVTVRGGLFYETAVAERSFAHVDFAAGQQLGAAVGGSFRFGRTELAVAYEYRHQPELAVSESAARVYQEVPGSQCADPFTADTCHPQYLGQPAPAVNAGAYRAHSHALSLDVLHRF